MILDLSLAHQLRCYLCQQCIPCFEWLHLYLTEPLPPLTVGDPVVFAERGEAYLASVQACSASVVILSVDFRGVFVQRIVLIEEEDVRWLRALPDYRVPQGAVSALLAAHALVQE